MPDVKKTDFANIDAYIKGMMRLLSSPNETPIFNGYLEENKNLSELITNSKLPEELLAFMESMNAKLEHIIGVLEHNKMEASFPINIEIRNISASELLFTCEQKLEPGKLVEAVLPLTQMPLSIAGGIGKIEPITHPKFGQIWKLSFTRIREQDLEAIVHFVFQQERKRIREIRWD